MYVWQTIFCCLWIGLTSWFNSFFFFFIWHLSAATQSNPTNDIDLEKQHSAEISEEDKELLQAYHHSFDDERVDLNLIVALLTYICDNSQEGEVSSLLKGVLLTPNQKLACFLLYLKIINTFLKNNICIL